MGRVARCAVHGVICFKLSQSPSWKDDVELWISDLLFTPTVNPLKSFNPLEIRGNYSVKSKYEVGTLAVDEWAVTLVQRGEDCVGSQFAQVHPRWVSSSTADCHSLTTSHQSAAAATTNCDNCGRLFDVRRRMPQRH